MHRSLSWRAQGVENGGWVVREERAAARRATAAIARACAASTARRGRRRGAGAGADPQPLRPRIASALADRAVGEAAVRRDDAVPPAIAPTSDCLLAIRRRRAASGRHDRARRSAPRRIDGPQRIRPRPGSSTKASALRHDHLRLPAAVANRHRRSSQRRATASRRSAAQQPAARAPASACPPHGAMSSADELQRPHARRARPRARSSTSVAHELLDGATDDPDLLARAPRARRRARTPSLRRVLNATGVDHPHEPRPRAAAGRSARRCDARRRAATSNLEFDLADRQPRLAPRPRRGAAAELTGAEAAIAVNNNAAAVLLAAAALAGPAARSSSRAASSSRSAAASASPTSIAQAGARARRGRHDQPHPPRDYADALDRRHRRDPARRTRQLPHSSASSRRSRSSELRRARRRRHRRRRLRQPRRTSPLARRRAAVAEPSRPAPTCVASPATSCSVARRPGSWSAPRSDRCLRAHPLMRAFATRQAHDRRAGGDARALPQTDRAGSPRASGCAASTTTAAAAAAKAALATAWARVAVEGVSDRE